MALSAGTRRTVACVLVGLGALLIVAALMIPTYTVGKMAKTPLDLEITTVAVNQPDQESLVLDSTSLTEEGRSAEVNENVPLVSQRFLTIEDPSDADQMTIQAGNTLRRIDKRGDTGVLSAYVDRVTIDRKTGEPVSTDPNGSIAMATNSKGESIAEPVHRTGLQYRFPIGTEKKTYPYFDVYAETSTDMEFVEETEINGTTVYHFRQNVPATDLSKVSNLPTNKLSLPAAKWGVEGGEEPVTMSRFYSNVRDLWVEPQTGTVVKGGEQLNIFYARSADKPEVPALKSHLVFDTDTVEAQLAIAKDNIDQLSLFGRVLPIVLGIVGLIALIAGILLGVMGGGSGRPARAGGPSGSRPGGPAQDPAGSDAPTTTLPRSSGADAPTETIKMPKNL
ncbi:DUF3068 domain-containing protein [Nocardia speluncae]|uniref:DUF3068 domain-containing protein n=1 Tax=Nocardia speluncae TaxID=419477 RepID=A0A846XS49_9NOCA|nr:DUF3068 domain-containing protein [Nocardia speluncae]NKY37640.1 DUF3068 domain-containing protein [Nocardia speluncae]